MVGAYNVYASVGERKAQGLAVGGGLDGGITLDECALVVVIGIGEPQMCRAGLSCELLALQRMVIEQVQFMGCGKVQNVKVHACSCSHIKRL